MDGAELSARSVGSAEGIPAGLLITTNSTVSALRRTSALFWPSLAERRSGGI